MRRGMTLWSLGTLRLRGAHRQASSLHFAGLNKGRYRGWQFGVAKATRPSTQTESLSHGAKTLGSSKTARLPEMCRALWDFQWTPATAAPSC
jgi:hypothetical protein